MTRYLKFTVMQVEQHEMKLGNVSTAELALSNSVDACVATLTSGHPAIRFTPSPRAALFERLGLGEIRNQLAELDPTRLEEEQEEEITWLKDKVA